MRHVVLVNTKIKDLTDEDIERISYGFNYTDWYDISYDDMEEIFVNPKGDDNTEEDSYIPYYEDELRWW